METPSFGFTICSIGAVVVHPNCMRTLGSDPQFSCIWVGLILQWEVQEMVLQVIDGVKGLFGP